MTTECDVCRRVRECGVACYPYGPISIAYCVECIRQRAYPYWLLEGTILQCGGRDKMYEGWGDGDYFFKDGEYHSANEIQVTKEQCDKFWDGFQKACDKLPPLTNDEEDTKFWREENGF